MKKLFLPALLLVCAFGTAELPRRGKGTGAPAAEQDFAVKPKDGVIDIVLNDKFYEIVTDFVFYNPGQSAEAAMRWPFLEPAGYRLDKIYDVQCWANGRKIEYEETLKDLYLSAPAEPKNAFTAHILFDSKAYTHTKVSYKADYGYDSVGYVVTCFYGTSIAADYPIEKLTLRIRNNMKYDRVYAVKMGNTDIEKAFVRSHDNTFATVFTYLKQEKDTAFQIFIKDIADDTGPQSFPAYFRFIKYKMNADDLFWYRKDQLRVIRKTIYALHGDEFKSQDLIDLFAEWGKYWSRPYKVNPNFSEEDFSDIEKENIKILLAEEKARK